MRQTSVFAALIVLFSFSSAVSAYTNLIANGDGDGGSANWTFVNGFGACTGSGTNTWCASNAFYGSHTSNQMYQTVNLTALGYSANYLDSAPYVVSQVFFIGYHTICSDKYRVTIQLLNAAQGVITSNTTNAGWLSASDCVTWIPITLTLSGYGSGLRYIKYVLEEDDAENWGGNYGGIYDNATVYFDSSIIASFGSNPVNYYNSSSRNATFDFKCAGTSNVSAIELWTNSTGVWHANYSNSSYANNTWLNVSVQGLSEGNVVWGVYCNDSGGNYNWTSSNRTLLVDATAPSAITYVDPTPANGSSRGYNYSFVNATFTEANPSACLLNFVYSNSTSVNLSMTRSGSVCSFNVTTQPDGEANFTVYVNDSAGNWGANLTYYYFVSDVTPPSGVAYVDPTPSNGSTVNVSYAFVNASFVDSRARACLLDLVYSNSSEENVSMTLANGSAAYCFVNVSFLPDGVTSFKVYVNDSAGNWGWNSSYYYFNVSEAIAPTATPGNFVGGGVTPTPAASTPTPAPTPSSTPTPMPTLAVVTPRSTQSAGTSPTPTRFLASPAAFQPCATPASAGEPLAEAEEEDWWPATREGVAEGISVVEETIRVANAENVDVSEAERFLDLANDAFSKGDYAVASDYMKQSQAALKKAGVASGRVSSAGGVDWVVAVVAAALVVSAAAAYYFFRRGSRRWL